MILALAPHSIQSVRIFGSDVEGEELVVTAFDGSCAIPGASLPHALRGISPSALMLDPPSGRPWFGPDEIWQIRAERWVKLRELLTRRHPWGESPPAAVDSGSLAQLQSLRSVS